MQRARRPPATDLGARDPDRRGALPGLVAALSALHFPEASNVHVGKAIALDVAAPSAAAAEASVRAMCEKLLANPVTEDYEIAVDSGGAA